MHFALSTLEISLSNLAAHCWQWARLALPYGAKLRPHSPHVPRFAFTGREGGRPAAAPSFRRPPAAGRPPSLALRLAADILMRARHMARFSGSAMYPRMYSRMRLRPPSVRHLSEQ